MVFHNVVKLNGGSSIVVGLHPGVLGIVPSLRPVVSQRDVLQLLVGVEREFLRIGVDRSEQLGSSVAPFNAHGAVGIVYCFRVYRVIRRAHVECRGAVRVRLVLECDSSSVFEAHCAAAGAVRVEYVVAVRAAPYRGVRSDIKMTVRGLFRRAGSAESAVFLSRAGFLRLRCRSFLSFSRSRGRIRRRRAGIDQTSCTLGSIRPAACTHYYC